MSSDYKDRYVLSAHRSSLTLVAALLSNVFAANAAHAQAAERKGGLEEIVVTARKQAESLLDVPVSVTSVGEQTIKNYDLSSMESLSQAVPQLNLVKASTGGSNAIFTIRGVGTTPLDSGLAQSVLLVVDDVPSGQGNLITMGLFDLENVEVLKGPQALFFGKNSPAGVVSIRSKGPGDTFEANVRLNREFEGDENTVDFSVGGPVTDTLGVRLAAKYRDLGGYFDNDAVPRDDPFFGAVPGYGLTPGADHKREPKEEEWLARLTAVWQATDNLTATMKLSGSWYDSSGDSNLFGLNSCAPGQTTATILGVPDPQQSRCGFNERMVNAGWPEIMTAGYPDLKNGREQFTEQDTYFGSLKLDYQADAFDVASISSFVTYDHIPFHNNTVGSGAYFGGMVQEKFDSWAQELRLNTKFSGPLNFSTGAYYEDNTVEKNAFPNAGPVGPDPATGFWFSAHLKPKVDSKTKSAFGQIRYDINDQLEFATGVRYTKDEKELSNLENIYVHPVLAGLFTPVGQSISADFSDSNWSPEATLTYRINQDSMVYAAYKTGYKAGGLSATSVLTNLQTPESLEFESEESDGFEIGFKSQILNDTLRIQGAIYTYDFKNLQSAAFNNILTIFEFQNAGKARTRGVELEVQWAQSDTLTLRGNATYNKARYTEFEDAFCHAAQVGTPECVIDPALNRGKQDLTDQRLPQASDWNISAGFTFSPALLEGFNSVLYADANYRSKYNVSDVLIPQASVGGYTTVNAGVRLSPESDRWQLAVIGRNLTDKVVPTYVVDKPGGLPGETFYCGISRPRSIALEFSYHWL